MQCCVETVFPVLITHFRTGMTEDWIPIPPPSQGEPQPPHSVSARAQQANGYAPHRSVQVCLPLIFDSSYFLSFHSFGDRRLWGVVFWVLLHLCMWIKLLFLMKKVSVLLHQGGFDMASEISRTFLILGSFDRVWSLTSSPIFFSPTSEGISSLQCRCRVPISCLCQRPFSAFQPNVQ